MNKSNPICNMCMGYMLNFKDINNIEWLRCNCGYHIKLNKRTIEIISEKTHSEVADEYRRKKNNE